MSYLKFKIEYLIFFYVTSFWNSIKQSLQFTQSKAKGTLVLR